MDVQSLEHNVFRFYIYYREREKKKRAAELAVENRFTSTVNHSYIVLKSFDHIIGFTKFFV